MVTISKVSCITKGLMALNVKQATLNFGIITSIFIYVINNEEIMVMYKALGLCGSKQGKTLQHIMALSGIRSLSYFEHSTKT